MSALVRVILRDGNSGCTSLVVRVALFFQHAALPEGAGHIDLLAEVLHRLLEQCELFHLELLVLLASSSLGSHAMTQTPCW